MNYKLAKSQSGAALITAMVLLTLLALTSMTTTTLEEKMATNSQEINRVFQAAETGLARSYNDDNAFSTSNTVDSPYTPSATTIGDYGVTMNYTAAFVQSTIPPRVAMFEVGEAKAYHFRFNANATAASGTETNLGQGAFQIGPAGVN